MSHRKLEIVGDAGTACPDGEEHGSLIGAMYWKIFELPPVMPTPISTSGEHVLAVIGYGEGWISFLGS